MSIDIDRFETADEEELEERTNAEKILEFLAKNSDKAWKQSEIAKHTDVNHNSMGPTLRRLHEKELVRHKGEYWAITNDEERLEKAYHLHRLTEALNEEYGSEDMEEWMEHAVDDDEEGDG